MSGGALMRRSYRLPLAYQAYHLAPLERSARCV